MGELDTNVPLDRRLEVVRAPRVTDRFPTKGYTGMRLQGRAAAATTAILLAVLSACTGPPAAPSATPTPSTSSEPAVTESPSSSPTAASESEVAAANAERLIREYYVLRDELRSDETQSLDRLEDFATSIELASQQRLIQSERDGGEHQTGTTRIAELEVKGVVNLDNSDPSAGRVPVVEIEVCADVSDVDFVDASGNSIVDSRRPDTAWVRHHVANYDWESDPTNGWRVSSSETLERQPCETAG